MGDTFHHTVAEGDDLTVTVDLGDGTTRTFHVLPGSMLVLDRAELEGRESDDDGVLTAALVG